MNTRMKRRMIAVSGAIVIVLLIVMAVVGGNSASKNITVTEAANGSCTGEKVQVSGNVVDNSYSTNGNILTFEIYDPENTNARLLVEYEGAASSTFGNGVTAICTGRMGESNILACTELVTKCPSKYESGTDALSIERLLSYGDSMIGTMVKVRGSIANGSLGSAGDAERFVLEDVDTGMILPVHFDGGLSNNIGDGSTVIVTGSLLEDDSFGATDVALEE